MQHCQIWPMALNKYIAYTLRLPAVHYRMQKVIVERGMLELLVLLLGRPSISRRRQPHQR